MSVEKVKEYFKKYYMDEQIIEHQESTATVSDAASALNCQEAEIAKTLSFRVSDDIILIVMSGDAKIDNSKYKERFKVKAKMVESEMVEELIGHAVGGVCPFAINDNIKVYLDESLKRFKYVYPACGSSNSAIKLTIPELEKYSNFTEWIDVGGKYEK